MSGAHRRRPARAAGFTLVEVLVAVAVLALTLGAFISGGSQYADNARYLQDRTLALWVARNRMVQYQLAEEWPDTGKEDGTVSMGEREWEWRSEISESPDPAVRRIDIAVHRINRDTNDPEEDSLASLSGFVTENGGSQATPAPGGAP